MVPTGHRVPLPSLSPTCLIAAPGEVRLPAASFHTLYQIEVELMAVLTLSNALVLTVEKLIVNSEDPIYLAKNISFATED